MVDFGLSSQQLAVICALSNGATIIAGAAEAGVHRNTVANWHRTDLSFKQALAQAQYDRALYFREKMEALADLAAQTLNDILADPNAPASVRLKAALAVLQTASTPPQPKKQVEEKLHNDAQPQSQPQPADPTEAVDSIRVHSCSFVANPAHNPAQRQHTKIGRNEPCPCGSGAKYKRCCLNKPAQQSQAAA